jgi:hypothetical protein
MVDVSSIGEPIGTTFIEAIDGKCEHLDECQLSEVVLYYLDGCKYCQLAEKFK